MAQEGNGRIFRVISQASGVHIPLTRAQYVEFVCFVATGDNTLTIKESISGASEQNLVNITKAYITPGIGGVSTKVTQTAAATFTNADATNDQFSVAVRARALSDGFNSVEGTVDAGTCTAIIYELSEIGDPEDLVSTIVA